MTDLEATVIDAEMWQASWDAQQQAYLPDREERFAALLDTVEAVAGTAPRILDLAGGTGSISLRAAARWPDATTTVVDVDDALLALAEATVAARGLGDRITVLQRDLASPGWTDGLGTVDAVLTATALHWLPAERIAGVYAEARGLLRDGGVLVNVDHHADDGLPTLTPLLRDVRRPTGDPWGAWWDEVRADADLAPYAARRDARFGGDHATSATPPLSWHLDALRRSGFRETGLVWRGLTDAAVAGVR